MGSLREIKERIGSVKSTLKITSAMKLVASSKLRKSQKAIEAMHPYKEALEDILSSVPSVPGMSRESEGGRTAIVAIASNSSLCGSFNANIIKVALQEASRYDDSRVIAIGRKMSDAVRKAGFPQEKDLSSLVGKPSYDEAGALAQSLIDAYLKGEYGRVILVYNHFVSTSRQEPVVEQYLPLAAQAPKEELEETVDEYIFEPSAEEISGEILPQVLRLKVFTAILDSAAAEHAARTVAMQTATDNAEDILSELTLEYNKGRQQKITAEILDLVGGTAE